MWTLDIMGLIRSVLIKVSIFDSAKIIIYNGEGKKLWDWDLQWQFDGGNLDVVKDALQSALLSWEVKIKKKDKVNSSLNMIVVNNWSC